MNPPAGATRLLNSLELMYGHDDERTDRPLRQQNEFRRALRTVVKVRGRCRELRSIVKYAPLDLENLMDNVEPDDPSYWAIVLVYNRYEVRIMEAFENKPRRKSALHKNVKGNDRRKHLSIVGTVYAVSS